MLQLTPRLCDADLHEGDRPAGPALTIQIVALRKRARRRVRRSGAAKAITRATPGRDDRRDSDVAKGLISFGPSAMKAITQSGWHR
jgi:hypothetical protein